MLGEQVTAAHIAEVVSRSTGIPVDRLMAAEKDKLLHMEEALARQVQAPACVSAVSLRHPNEVVALLSGSGPIA